MIASENAARSPRATPEPSTAAEDNMSRDQIAQSLASKDPAWFRQTADRGLTSPAYRRNQVEDEERADHGLNAARVQMPGMSRENSQPEKAADEPIDRSLSPTRSSRSYGGESQNSGSISLGNDSPLSLTPAQRLDPPEESKNEPRALAMSPSQGRISPERLGRSPSPTKGMGGFVQSAMMKRSDSVNKRWSVQSPPGTGISRGNSVASNRGSQDAGSVLAGEPSRSRDDSHEPTSRPSSSHSNATITQERPGSSASMRSSATASTNDGFVKPSVQAARSRSPTKTSWLESTLLRPESPKPKAAPPTSQQPAWMQDLKKKQSADLGSASSPPKHHAIKVGGLLRSPPPGGLNKSPSIGGFPAGFSSTVLPKTMTGSSHSPRNSQDPAPAFKSPPNPSRPKPETPPKKMDFRASLKPRQPPPTQGGNDEPEFKNVFGALKKTKTQNFVAPDELKANITRGKRGLTITGGPQKTELKDEFKEAILKKKDDFKVAQIEGKGVVRSASGGSQDNAIPEFLAKRQEMGRSGSITTIDKPGPLSPSRQRSKVETPVLSPTRDINPPSRFQAKESIGNKLAGRFNPALASLLARGPPSAASDSSRSTSPVSQRTVSMSTSTTNQDSSAPGPQLSHMTKGRARGPKRKAPTTAPTASADVTPSASEPVPPKRTQVEDQKSLATPKAPLPKPFTPQDSAPKASKDEDDAIQPASPRKLDLKRRSQFLQDLSNNKPEQLSPQPLSPIKRENGPETPLKSQKSKPELKAKPETPLKSPSLKSPKSTYGFDNSPRPKQQGPLSPPIKSPSLRSPAVSPTLSKATPRSPIKSVREEAVIAVKADSLKSPLFPDKDLPLSTRKFGREEPVASMTKPQSLKSPTIWDKEVSQSQPTGFSAKSQPLKSPAFLDKELPQSPNKFTREEPAVSTRAAMWASKSPEEPTRVKSPIKLPTHADEKAALIEAGLRSPSPEKPFTVGLGIQNTTTRPLPVLPSKDFTSPPSSARFQASSPTKPLSSPPLSAGLRSNKSLPSPPPATDTSTQLYEFFSSRSSPPEYFADTATILSTRPDQELNVKTLRSTLYQLSPDGKKSLVPNHQERMLFEGNLYICTHTFGNAAGKKVTEVYYWIGDDVQSQVANEAKIFAQRETKTAGGNLVIIHQGKETPEFFAALGGIIIVRRGSSNKYDSLAAHILCGRKHFGQVAFDEVDFAASSLCSGFAYLISTQSGKCYLWRGKGVHADELSCARLIGMDFGLMGDVEEVEDGKEPDAFLKIFGDSTRIPKSADHWRMKPNYSKYCGRLFLADGNSREQVKLTRTILRTKLTPSRSSKSTHSARMIWILARSTF